MSVGSQSDLAHAIQERVKARIPGEIAAQHQRVDEKSDQSFDLPMPAVGYRRAHQQLPLTGVAVEQGEKRRQERHEKRRALAETPQRLGQLGWGSVLVIDGSDLDQAFAKAARNIPGVDVLPQQGANVYDILRRDMLVLTRYAVQALEARLT